ncbi:MAG: hypothetical protein RJA76_1074, partial [Bacteroidota bacterium]
NILNTSLSGSYQLKVLDANACAAVSAASNLTVNPVPIRPGAIVTQPSCSSPFGKIEVTNASVNGNSYSIDGTNFSNISGVFTDVPANQYQVYTKSADGCISSSSLVVLNEQPTTPVRPGTISGNVNPFVGTRQTYQISPVNGASYYQWTLPNGWSGTSSGLSIQTSALQTGGTISVKAVGSGGCLSPAQTLLIQPNNLQVVSDVNTGIINNQITGDISTNDVIYGGATYSNPQNTSGNGSSASFTLNADGSYTFEATTPGIYTYNVSVCPIGQSSCSISKVTFTIKNPLLVNNPPIANNDVATVISGNTVTTPVLANDKCTTQNCNLPVSGLTIVNQPAHGTAIVLPNGTISYTPTNGYVGNDVLTYQICQNGTSNCATATISYGILAGSQTDVTTAGDDFALTKGTAQIEGNVLINDASTNNNATLLVSSWGSLPSNKGTLTGNANGTFTFTPAPGFVGSIDVVYTVCDQSNPANCSNATLHIVVDPAPTASNDVINNRTNGVFVVDILANDQIQAGQGISISRQNGTGAGTAQGSVSFDPLTGLMIYTPSPFDGNTVTVGYTVCDTNYSPAQCAQATVSIMVCDPNNASMDCDGDGVNNGQEVIDGTDPASPCSFNVRNRTNSPSIVWNAADCDGDGVSNGQEMMDGTNPSLSCDYKTSSQNTSQTSASWKLLDCDGDGTPNGQDTQPLNFCIGGVSGVIPAIGTLPYDQYFKNSDCDGDGITNEMECNLSGLPLDTDYDGIPNYLDTDSDNDGILDSVEQNRDSDGDGVADYQDLDADNDGIYDKQEGFADLDKDGIPNYLDLDSDGDGLKDAWEALPIYVPNRDDNYDGKIDKNGQFIDKNGNGMADISEAQSPTDTDKDGIPDYLDLDADNDCIPDGVELTNDLDQDGLQNYRDNDSDGDGINDSFEAGNCNNPVDTDGDGIPDFLDLDSDNDGIKDAIELGPNPNLPIDTDGDGIPDFKDTDADNDGIPDNIELGPDPSKPLDSDGDSVPNYRDLDSDNDGIPDQIEIGNNPLKPRDTDGDGIPDYLDLDSDGDGLPDKVEVGKDPKYPLDSDKDGVPDYLDLDSDNDGILDTYELGPDPKNPLDTDGDGLPDYVDSDSDNDGISDAFESGKNPNNPVDTDRDGIPDFRDTDSDGDGIPDAIEAGKDPKNPIDSDGDGIPDYLDLDSDGDGISDKLEGILDTDKDGILDYLDLDADNDGIPDKVEGLGDPDGDGTPNFRDTDSDGDNIPDKTEGNVDSDGDGRPNYLDTDSDGDGILDSIEGNQDTDSDGLPDYLDLDSDNDGYLDQLEGFVDTDKDGIPDFRDLDSDGDGIPDKLENDIDYGGLPDCDGDGIDNRIDPDTCPNFATQGLSPNNDGINDFLILPGVKAYKNHLAIYNRWGNLVYEVDNYQNDWGGQANRGHFVQPGDLYLPDGTYYYMIEFYGVKPNMTNFIYINRSK